jgi:hypothetical protein
MQTPNKDLFMLSRDEAVYAAGSSKGSPWVRSSSVSRGSADACGGVMFCQTMGCFDLVTEAERTSPARTRKLVW